MKQRGQTETSQGVNLARVKCMSAIRALVGAILLVPCGALMPRSINSIRNLSRNHHIPLRRRGETMSARRALIGPHYLLKCSAKHSEACESTTHGLNATQPKALLFVHLSKCGGTNVVRMLQAHSHRVGFVALGYTHAEEFVYLHRDVLRWRGKNHPQPMLGATEQLVGRPLAWERLQILSVN